jgi:hypothetical protein
VLGSDEGGAEGLPGCSRRTLVWRLSQGEVGGGQPGEHTATLALWFVSQRGCSRLAGQAGRDLAHTGQQASGGAGSCRRWSCARSLRRPPGWRLTRDEGPQLASLRIPALEGQAQVVVAQGAAHVDVAAADVVRGAVDAHRLRGRKKNVRVRVCV